MKTAAEDQIEVVVCIHVYVWPNGNNNPRPQHNSFVRFAPNKHLKRSFEKLIDALVTNEEFDGWLAFVWHSIVSRFAH